jgi:ankyrin repeat protein
VLKGLADAGFESSKTYRKNPNMALTWVIDHYRAVEQVKKTVEILLDCGGDANTVRVYGALLHVAARHQDITLMRLLLDKGADVNLSTPSFLGTVSDPTPLTVAILYGCPLSARVLLAAGANVDGQTTDHKYSMLSLAVLQGRAELFVPMLLAHGAHLEIPDVTGSTPLEVAVKKKDLGALIALLESGAAIKGTGKSSRPFDIALKAGKMGVVSALLIYGADVHSSQALYRAVKHGHGKIVRLILKEYSADEDIQHVDEQTGNTILHVLAGGKICDTDVVDLIMGYGLNVDAEDMHGSTPLHHAAQAGSVMMVKKLLEHGANMHWKNHKGQFPVNLAREYRYWEVVEFLGEKGSDEE